ncbi:hypothetical protein PS2_033642 [Malus domestica]
MARSLNHTLRLRFDGHPIRATSIGMLEGEVPRIAEMSRMVGVIGTNGRTMVLVAVHQRLKAAIRSSLSMVISMVESLMALWMPRASHSLPKNFSIRAT